MIGSRYAIYVFTFYYHQMYVKTPFIDPMDTRTSCGDDTVLGPGLMDTKDVRV